MSVEFATVILREPKSRRPALPRRALKSCGADRNVEVLADHRNPGNAAAQRQRQPLPQRLIEAPRTMSVRGNITSLTLVAAIFGRTAPERDANMTLTSRALRNQAGTLAPYQVGR
jgi:hypothetical protein